MQAQPLPLFDPSPKKQRRGIPGFCCGDKVRWATPVPPSRALAGTVIGFTQRCTMLVIRTADCRLLTLAPEFVTNTTRTSNKGNPS